MSTNKVYGDRPNALPLVELGERLELPEDHQWYEGIDTSMSIDDCKQVRDNLHSADLVAAFVAFHAAPRPAAVYNIGGGRFSNCSMLEATAMCEEIAGRELDWTLSDDARIGDHRWWISDLLQFRRDYPDWTLCYDVPAILREIHDANAERSVTA
jgi:CDP-paratose 2-epimerase